MRKMRVQLLPFGVLKDCLSEAPLELPAEASVGDLLALLGQRLQAQPTIAQLLGRIAVSVNAEYAQPGRILQEGDLVGLLPPVSGGSVESAELSSPTRTYLTRAAIPADELVAAAKQGSDGAVVAFDGIVRDNTRGRRTLYLDYEAYEEMAERQIAECRTNATVANGPAYGEGFGMVIGAEKCTHQADAPALFAALEKF